jgi:hypothetical protein
LLEYIKNSYNLTTKTHSEVGKAISNLSLTKELKIYDGEIAASSTKTAGKTG